MTIWSYVKFCPSESISHDVYEMNTWVNKSFKFKQKDRTSEYEEDSISQGSFQDIILDGRVNILGTPLLPLASLLLTSVSSKIRTYSLLGILIQYFLQRLRKSQRKKRNRWLSFRNRKRCYCPYLMRNAMNISLVKVGTSVPMILPLECKTVKAKYQTSLRGNKIDIDISIQSNKEFSFIIELFSISDFTYFFFFKNYSWFTVLCQFLLYSKVTQSIYIYTHFLILSAIMFYPKRLDAIGPHCLSILNVIVFIY